jgi:hypothetical protein
MKKMTTAKKFSKLSLHRETLRAMNPAQLVDVAGGLTTSPGGDPNYPFPSQCSCCISECCG